MNPACGPVLAHHVHVRPASGLRRPAPDDEPGECEEAYWIGLCLDDHEADKAVSLVLSASLHEGRALSLNAQPQNQLVAR